MKKTTPLLCLAVTALLLFACTNNHQIVPALTGNSVKLDSSDASIFRSKTLADQDIKSYDSICRNVLHDTPIQYYTVRSRDLFAALGTDSALLGSRGICRYPYIRVTVAFERDSNQFRLYIQPATGANLDDPLKNPGVPLYFRRNGTIVTDTTAIRKTRSDSLFVADLNAPCPNTCGGN